jgi:hypothetical protein
VFEMAQVYSDPSRESDAHSLPNVEVFYAQMGQLFQADPGDEYGGETDNSLAGWYWQACFPGCMPDSDPFGPFETEAEAIKAAQENID